MAQAVSRRSLTAEARIRFLLRPYGICGAQNDTRIGVSLSSSALPCRYHSTVALHTHMSPGGRTTGLLVAAVQRHSLTPSTRTTIRLVQLGDDELASGD
jgi:hypothetical protein